MSFLNQIVAGTRLVRAAIQSPNYSAGVSGWSINRDGSAELNDVLVRGATSVGGQALYYAGTPAAGNLRLSISAAPGVDEFGNSFRRGIAVYGANGAQVITDPSGYNGAGLYLTPAPTADQEFTAAGVVTGLDQFVIGQDVPKLELIGPTYAFGSGASPSVSLYGEGNHGEATLIELSAQKVRILGSLSASNTDGGTAPVVMSSSTTDIPVTFSKTFPAVPRVIGTLRGSPTLPAGSSALIVRSFGVTTTGCTLRVSDTGGVSRSIASGLFVDWEAKSG